MERVVVEGVREGDEEEDADQPKADVEEEEDGEDEEEKEAKEGEAQEEEDGREGEAPGHLSALVQSVRPPPVTYACTAVAKEACSFYEIDAVRLCVCMCMCVCVWERVMCAWE